MNKQLQNELSDEQLDAISGGSYSRDCDRRGKAKDCDDDDKKRHHKQRRNGGAEACKPTYAPHRCG